MLAKLPSGVQSGVDIVSGHAVTAAASAAARSRSPQPVPSESDEERISSHGK